MAYNKGIKKPPILPFKADTGGKGKKTTLSAFIETGNFTKPVPTFMK